MGKRSKATLHGTPIIRTDMAQKVVAGGWIVGLDDRFSHQPTDLELALPGQWVICGIGSSALLWRGGFTRHFVVAARDRVWWLHRRSVGCESFFGIAFVEALLGAESIVQMRPVLVTLEDRGAAGRLGTFANFFFKFLGSRHHWSRVPSWDSCNQSGTSAQ